MDEENLSCAQRSGNCCRIHWNGFFYFLSPMLLLPLLFVQPVLENRTLYLMLLALLWYAVDVMPQGVIGVLPIIFFPIMGVLSSMDACMAYARDSQMVFMLSCYVGIMLVHSKLDRYIALRYLKMFGVSPARILASLMIFTFLLSALIPDACACSIMVPIAKAILQILDEISVCKAIDESVILKDDEKPYPSKVANAFYIGVAYAANMGGMTTLWASESGYEFLQTYNNLLTNSNADSNIFLKYIITSLPMTICLLIFTIIYLQVIFLGLMRSNEQRITYNNETSMSALDTIHNSESHEGAQYIVITLCLMIVYVTLLIVVKIVEQLRDTDDKVYAKYSAYLMLICLIAFVSPNNCSFLNYFICKKPAEYKMSPSILPWSIIPKLMPWSHFFVYGSSLAYGVAIKNSGLYTYLAESLVGSKSIIMKQLGFMGVGSLLSIVAANHLVTEAMLLLGVKSGLLSASDPSLVTIPIVLACSLSFMLPVSSVTNCFVSGWGYVRSKDMMLAGIAPTIVGYILIFVFISIANLATPFFNKPAYDLEATF